MNAHWSRSMRVLESGVRQIYTPHVICKCHSILFCVVHVHHTVLWLGRILFRRNVGDWKSESYIPIYCLLLTTSVYAKFILGQINFFVTPTDQRWISNVDINDYFVELKKVQVQYTWLKFVSCRVSKNLFDTQTSTSNPCSWCLQDGLLPHNHGCHPAPLCRQQ